MADDTNATQTETTTETPQTDAGASGGAQTEQTPEETTILGDAGGEGGGEGGQAEGEKSGEGATEAVPENYDLTAPEGFALDAESVALATPVFKELGLNNEQANKLMPVAAQFAERIQQQGQQAILAEVQAQRKAWAEEAQNDPEIGGARFKETTELAAKALDAMGYPKGSPFRSFLTDSGLGNHPEMIRLFRKIGEKVSEDTDFVRADAGAQIKPPREAVLYPNDVPK